MTPPARRLAAVFVGVAAALVAGCRATPCRRLPATPVAACVYESAPPESDAPDLAGLVPLYESSPADVPTLLPRPTDDCDALDAATCQCNAATSAALAGAIELERHWAGVLACCEEGAAEASFCLTRSLLPMKVTERRNTAAAAALKAFYALGGVEAQQRWLDQGVLELETTVRRLDRLRERGLPTPDQIDRDALAVRLDGLRDKNLELELLRVQLNGQLRRLLGCPLDGGRLFWPRVDWAVDLEPLDAEAQVATGLSNRPDLRALRLVRCRLTDDTLPVARKVLGAADPTLGSVSLPPGPLHKLRCGACDDHELAVRCRQLSIVESDASRLATAAILGAVYKVASTQDRVRLARRAVEDRRRELRSLEKRREAEGLSIFEISAARGRLIDAEAKLVERVVDLKIARVELREATGMLATGCEACGGSGLSYPL